jgi:hypothetical protein
MTFFGNTESSFEMVKHPKSNLYLSVHLYVGNYAIEKLTAHGATMKSIKLGSGPRKKGPVSCISEVNSIK